MESMDDNPPGFGESLPRVGVAMLPQLNSSEVHGEEVRGEEAFVGNRRVG